MMASSWSAGLWRSVTLHQHGDANDQRRSWLSRLRGPVQTHATPTHTDTPSTSTPSARLKAQSDDFEQFFRQHQSAISGYLWRMTGDEYSASELCQETFLRAWQHFDRVRSYEQPSAWLLRVASNLALNYLRRRRGPVGAAARLDEANAPGTSDPSDRFVERDLVRETLLELSPKARALLVLREVYGFSGPEVCETLQVSREAAKLALWRARAQFRTAYMRKEEQL